MASYKEIMLELPDSYMAAITWGPSNGKPLLAVHGWLDNAASFVPLIPYLEDYHVIALDMPGHGHSAHIPKSAYFHVIDYVADVVKVLHHLGWEQCALLGHSLGAGVVSAVAGTIPDKISAVALLDGIGVLTEPAYKLPKLVESSMQEYLRLQDKKPPVYENVEAAIGARLRATKMDPESVALIVNRNLKTTDDGVTWRTDPRLLFTPLVLPTEEQLMAFIERISTQTCLIRAHPGYPFDQEVMDKRVSAVKHMQVHNVEGDHHVHMDHPDRVGPILKNFFAQNV